MAKSKLRIDIRRTLNDGTYPIQIVVGHGTNLYLSTGIYASLENWDRTTNTYIGKSAKRYNSTLLSMLTNVTNRILELKESGQWPRLTQHQIKQLLTNLEMEKPTVDIPSIASIFEKMLEGRRDRTKGTARSTLLKIEAFAGDPDKLSFDDINRSWLEEFYKSMSDLSINTKSTYMKSLRRAFNYAMDRDITTNNPFRSYHINTEETRMRVLTIDKMRLLINLELQGMYPEYRDLFMLTFFLIGINTIDLSELTEDNIKDGRIEYRRAKTNKLYSIKIEPEAQEIIDRYKGTKHLIRCFDRYKDYKALMGSVDNALVKMGPPLLDKKGNFIFTGNHRKVMNPIDPKLSIYYARYSWATFAAELDIPKDTISEALGHSYGSAITGVYIKFKHDKIDEANRRVLDYVLYNKKG